jgi:uncharacterized protein (TIGR02466 family)
MAIIQPLFPINIWVENYKDNVTEDVIDFIKNQNWVKNSFGDIEDLQKFKNSRSSNYHILENSIMSNIKHIIELNVNEYSRGVLGYKDVDFYITQSWCNKNELNEHHHEHNHPNSIISGVLYICCGNDTPSIKFVKDRDLNRTIQINKNITEYNQEIIPFYPEVGDLLIFPSSLSHSVGTNKSSIPRISISFNTFIHGTLGNEVSLNKLEL